MQVDTTKANDATSQHPDVHALRSAALQSLTLSIELFNRPHNCARREAVLILLHHNFDLLRARTDTVEACWAKHRQSLSRRKRK